MGRRPDGALERDVMRVLWTADDALIPADVRERLDADLAYTTVMTILARLHDKGRVHRVLRGRAYAYTASVSESELAVEKMTAALSATSDRVGALSGFVGGLNKRDLAALRRVVERGG
jgi:predicted transcriptional regulator